MRVNYLSHMGSDRTVLNAARASYDKSSDDLELSDGDKRLLVYLARGYTHDEWEALLDKLLDGSYSREELHDVLWCFKNQSTHFAPFCHPTITLRVEAPLAIARQLWKSHIGCVGGDSGYAAWSETSFRYREAGEVYTPGEWRGRAETNKQGSAGVVDWEDDYLYADLAQMSQSVYESMLSSGIAPEQARFSQLCASETSWVWTGSLMFFARLCCLRLDHHAQLESSFVAESISEIMAGLFPHSWKALRLGV